MISKYMYLLNSNKIYLKFVYASVTSYKYSRNFNVPGTKIYLNCVLRTDFDGTLPGWKRYIVNSSRRVDRAI